VIRDVLFFQPSHKGTSLREALDYVNRVLPRRAIIFLLSDFLDREYERALKRTGRRHDLIAGQLTDPREAELPSVGPPEGEDAARSRRRRRASPGCSTKVAGPGVRPMPRPAAPAARRCGKPPGPHK